ncbi:MAG TPA: CAP domain-containing protein, partial [Polyangium sp.]|nr:CAP domain-containing protein [Polyangium sp.]
NPLDPFVTDVMTGLNDLRKCAGAPAVTVCASLHVATSAHGDDMRDKNYLSDVAPGKSTTPMRACGAGYMPGCTAAAELVEFIAKGHGEGTVTLDQWKMDPESSVMLTKPEFVVVGIGRSLGADQPIWTMDIADKNDASCGE